MNRFMLKVFLASVLTVGLNAPSHAQLEGLEGLTALLSFEALALPGLDGGAGLGGGLGGSGLGDLTGALDGLGGAGGSGDFAAIPFFGPVLVLVSDTDFLDNVIPSPPVERFALGTALVEDLVLGAIANPEAVFSTIQELGVNAGIAAVPVLGVLMEDPAGLADYFANGGTILLPAAGSSGGSSGSIFPGAPLLTDPLVL